MILGSPSSFLALLAIFLGGTLLLSIFDTVRNWALAVRWKNSSVLLSPYTLTVADTVLALASFVVVILLHHPAPAGLYKAF